MKSKTVISVIVAISMTTGGFSFAQGRGNRDDRGHDEQAHDQQERHGGKGHQQERHDNGRAHNNERYEHRDERGAGPNHNFYRGERLPIEYRHRNYVVDDWRGHRLSAPPRGYHWVQAGGDYVLVAIATGLIVQMLLNN